MTETVKVIKLTGELEVGRKDDIDRALGADLVATSPAVLLDLSEVTYADSTALAALLRFRGNAHRAGAPMAILIGSRQFARLIEYAGLSQAFNVFSDRGAALTFLSNESAR